MRIKQGTPRRVGRLGKRSGVSWGRFWRKAMIEVQAPTLYQLKATVFAKRLCGWKAIGQPMWTGEGYCQTLRQACFFC